MPIGSKRKDTKAGSRPAKSAVQGEGDYVSARSYNERTRAFVNRMTAGQIPAQPGKTPTKAEMLAAEKQALARSRGRAGDRIDARLMKNNVTAAGTRSRGRG